MKNRFTVISGGTIIDGTLAPAFEGDVVLEGDRIADVIRGNCEYAVPLTFTRNLTTVCDAIHASADTDEIVRISPEDWRKPL